jgi:Ca2+-binding EF-hand superfamily protein
MQVEDKILEEQLLATGNISKAQLNEIRHMFELVDIDKNGTLSFEEVGRLIIKIVHSNDLIYSRLIIKVKITK